MIKRFLSTLLFFIILSFNINAVYCEEPDILREKTGQFYYELFKINSTGDLRVGPLLSYLDPKVVVTHQGPSDPSAPFYKTYTPGCVPYSAFMGWVLDIMRTTTIETFIPEYSTDLGTLGIPDLERYMMVEGNVVFSHVLEGGRLVTLDFTHLLNPIKLTTPWAVDNMHLVYFNDKGLIEKLVFISHSESFMDAVDGVPSFVSDFEFSQARAVEVENYFYGPWHNKGMGAAVVSQMETGKSFGLELVLADDVVCQIPGTAPFCGLYYGKDEVEEFIRLISAEVTSLEINEMVAEGNKAGIKCVMSGLNSETGAEFCSKETVFSFQFDAEGKIVSIFCNYDTYAVAAAYYEE